MQVFQKRDGARLGGIDEAIAVLRECSGVRERDGSWRAGGDELIVQGLHEGDAIGAREGVLTISGDYTLFAHLETVSLGSLPPRTAVMSNAPPTPPPAPRNPTFYSPPP